MRWMLLTAILLCPALAQGGEAIHSVKWGPLTQVEREAAAAISIHPLPLPFTPYNTCRPKVPYRCEVMADRNEYLADDPVGQFLVYFVRTMPSAAARLKIEVVNEANGKVAASRELAPVEAQKIAFLLEMGALAPGNYRVKAALVGIKDAPEIMSCAFTKSAESRKVEPFPAAGVALMTHAQKHVPDAVWPVTTGVPLPRHSANDVSQFRLLENGRPVPAQFSVRANWYPDREVKWMGLDFQARYDNGKPRDYRLVIGGPAAPEPAGALKVAETDAAFEVDTGALRFKVGKTTFAGIEEVVLLNLDGTPAGKPVVSGAGGPFLVDERGIRYSAARDRYVTVTLEDSGPLRATICAKGWYVSDDITERCCQFTTRMTAYAGQPWINVYQETVITYDTDRKKLRMLGFGVKTADAAKWSFGGDGKSFNGDLPAPAKDKNNRPLPLQSVWLHQDRFDHFRLMQGEDQSVATGAKSDGWAAVTSPAATTAVFLRNIWQLFPKEMELSRDGINLMFWPRHGTNAFTEEEETGRQQIHQLHYAHQGKYLDLKFPQKYYDAMRAIGPALEQQDLNALTANGLGLAVSNDFCLAFQTGPAAADALAARAALYQQNPHAVTDPVYSGLTEVEGRFAGSDPRRFPDVERMLTDGYRSFTMSVDILNDYGMWIWPNTHNHWSPVTKTTQWHRWWHNSHYQNVWEGNFLYWRSGNEMLYQWARNNTRNFMNVGTVNYDDPANPMAFKLKGAMFHCKGFLPWGSPRAGERCSDDYVEVGAHFIDADAFILHWLLFGDRRGKELAEAWGAAFQRVALPPERSRECVTALGDMLSYYTMTWDPQAILYIRDLANDMNSRPFGDVPAFPVHPFFHSRWAMRYWELTRDPLVRERVLESFKPDKSALSATYGFGQLRALAWRWTGDKTYLMAHLPSLSTLWEGAYDNPGDPLSLMGARGHFFPSPSFGQLGPYFIQALLDAGITAIPPSDYRGVPVSRPVKFAKDKPTGTITPMDKPVYGRKEGWLLAKGAEPAVTIEFTGVVFTHDPACPGVYPAFIRIEDADGKVLLETSILYGSKRPTASITLDARKEKAPWRIYTNGNDPTFKWTGPAEELYIGPTPDAVKAAAEGKKVAWLGDHHDREGTARALSVARPVGEPGGDCGCH